MSIKVMNAVWESDVQTGRLTLLALADNANDGGLCKPGTAYLSGKTGKSRRTVFRDLEALEAEDVLQRRARTRPNGSRTSNAYRINIELLYARRRSVSDDEVSELAALFDDDTETPGRGLCQNDTGGVPDHGPECQTVIGGVSNCHRGGASLTPPGPSFEPKEDPPYPPAARGDTVLDNEPDPVTVSGSPEHGEPGERCAAHGRLAPPHGLGCRPCGTSTRAQAWRAAETSELDTAEAARRLRECAMCDAEGKRVDRCKVPLSPYRTCDHTTPLSVVLAEIAAADTAEPTRTTTPFVPSSRKSMRATALRAILRQPDSGTEEDPEVENTTDLVHNGGVPARSG